MSCSSPVWLALSGKRGGCALIDGDDEQSVRQFRWHHANTGYAGSSSMYRMTGLKLMLMHRLIATPPDGMQIDHINGNKLDNRRANLRFCTIRQNAHNVRTKRQLAGDKLKGTCWDKSRGKWLASICHAGANLYLGRYDSEREAALAYDAKARELFGEFAALNFPNEG